MSQLLSVTDVSRRYGAIQALKSTSFDLYEGELLAFVGPSGAGKTTLLKILAGLEPPDGGTVRSIREFNRDHPAILVFQDYLLFPHLTVFENVAYGLRARRGERKLGRSEVREQVCRYLEQLDIADKADTRPEELSGGQKQRVALARALVMEPSLLLLDEPFANLDKTLKRTTAQFVRDVQHNFGVTTVIVSHDLEETVEIADRIGVIIDGSLRQIGTFQEVYRKPENLGVAELFGPVNKIPEGISELMISRCGDQMLSFRREGKQIYCRPESLHITLDPEGPGRVTDLRLRGGMMQYEVEISGWFALASSPTKGFSIGDTVDLTVDEVIGISSEV